MDEVREDRRLVGEGEGRGVLVEEGWLSCSSQWRYACWRVSKKMA